MSKVRRMHRSQGARRTWAKPFYSSKRWQALRRSFLQAYPQCHVCRGPSKVADHIKPPRNVEEFWSGPFQPMCSSCHSKKTNRHDKPRVHEHTGCDREGMPVDGSAAWVT